MTVEQMIELKKQERKAQGLFVRIAVDDAIGYFDYYPNTMERKADYIRKTLARGIKILEQ